ncbi:MAG: tryptophan--tRNA ligase, partial [Coxiellaceae bacterium]|nr:tryptophan--tRNA ligase [Coxiellaceae bacterium]
TIRKKVMSMYTDPNRLRASDPGKIEGNPLWVFHDTFNPDKKWVEETKAKYREGSIGDVDCKKKLIEVLVELLTPMQKRRAEYEKDPEHVLKVLRQGAEKANATAEATLKKVKEAVHQLF